MSCLQWTQVGADEMKVWPEGEGVAKERGARGQRFFRAWKRAGFLFWGIQFKGPAGCMGWAEVEQAVQRDIQSQASQNAEYSGMSEGNGGPGPTGHDLKSSLGAFGDVRKAFPTWGAESGEVIAPGFVFLGAGAGHLCHGKTFPRAQVDFSKLFQLQNRKSCFLGQKVRRVQGSFLRGGIQCGQGQIAEKLGQGFGLLSSVFTQRYFGATDIAPSRGDGSRMSKKQQHLIPQKQAAFLAGL